MEREAITQLFEREVLAPAAPLFGTSKDRLGKFDNYEGCANKEIPQGSKQHD